MNEGLARKMPHSPLFGFAFLKLIVDDRGQAIDYLFQEVSVGFQKTAGFRREEMIGKKASEIFCDRKRNYEWIEYFKEAVSSNKIREIYGYLEIFSRECSVIIVPSAMDCLTLIIRDSWDAFRENVYSSITLNMLLAILSEYSTETIEHTGRLGTYCLRLGQLLQLSPEEKGDLSLLALLHDIGKIGVNPAILNKPAPLTDSEWMEMKRHPEIGWRIVKEIPDIKNIANYILCHHERWDGKGYPAGLKANHIPLPSRILAVADAYDAMTNDRIYRKKMEREEALEELKKNAGTQFDPQVVDYFIKAIMS